MTSLICGIQKRNDTNGFAKQRLTALENELTVVRGGEGRREEKDNQGAWDRLVHTAIFKMGNQLGPIVHPMELYSMLCGSLDGMGVWGEWIHVYVWLTPFAAHLKLSQHY